jgi:hypothetical protein
MSDQAIVTLLATPAFVAMAWILFRSVIATFVLARKAGNAWPALAGAVNLASVAPTVEGKIKGYGALEGERQGRKVRLDTGYRHGSGSRQSAETFTTWITKADLGLVIQDLKAVDRMLPQSDAQTGDAAFDKGFHVEGDPETVARVLTPAAREAISAYTRTLGGFSLGPEGLKHQTDTVVLEGPALTAVLDWQAWLLDALTSGNPAGPEPATVPPPPSASCISALIALLAIFGFGGAATAYKMHVLKRASPAGQVGKRFLANFSQSGNWYPAVAAKDSLMGLVLVYVDGAIEIHPLATLVPDRLGVGSRVLAPRDGANLPCTLEERRGAVARVRFDDGSQAWLSLGQVFVKRDGVDQAAPTQSDTKPEEVLAIWKDDPWLYPGTVIGRENGKVHVLFQDGSMDWRTPEQVRPPTWKAGDPLELKVAGKGWTPALYVQRLADRHAIAVDVDGQIRWTALALVRRPVKAP